VTVEPLLSCGHCEQCAAGFDNRCPEYGLIGLHRPGGFAERLIVAARRLYRVPAALDRCVAALAEPVAVVVHALRLGRFEASEPLLVLGAGLDRAAHGRGGEDLGSARDRDHRAPSAPGAPGARARRHRDARPRIDPTTVCRCRSRRHDRDHARGVDGAFYPMVVETVGGRADTLLDAGVAVGPGGRIVVLGVFQEMVRLDPWPLLLKEATLTWSLCYTRDAVATPAAGGADFEEAVRLLAAHPDLFARVLTHRVPLAEIDRAFALADDKSSGAVKVSVTP
jgi:L-iditol 2-dehydrogenase